MERKRLTTKGWHSIYSLMRDGEELREELLKANLFEDDEKKLERLIGIIKPYIQFVEAGVSCSETGLPLSDIWRYFRHTWVSEYKSLPGRTISILIRDAAVPNHPVIGIAALGSSVAQQTCRDEWIGWEGEVFIDKVRTEPTEKYAAWIIKTLDKLFDEIYLKDFFLSKVITLSDISNPSEEKINELRELSIHFKEKHINNPETAKFSSENEQMTWEQRALTNLFKSKRASVLAELMSIKLVLKKHGFKSGTKNELEKCLEKGDFRDAVQKLVRKAKSVHVGINMMDIIICGSIPPYNHLLGGKLICMLLTSPEVVDYYNNKYRDSVSLIASSMKGDEIVRDPKLVLLGTTSLYGVGSSQYNRIKIPADQVGGTSGNHIEYKELGYSEGYGSFHFSASTLSLADSVCGIRNGRTRVNSIFGEGSNPLMRKVKEAIEHLKLDSKPILNHRNKRVVYGIALAENFGELLLGFTDVPRYYIPKDKPRMRSDMINKYWIKRWLTNRINNTDVLNKVGRNTLVYPVTHGARVPLPMDQDPLT